MSDERTRDDDLWRYVEYLQRDLVPRRPRTWVTHEEYLTWVQANRANVGRSIPEEDRAEYVARLERNLIAFNPSTPFHDYNADENLRPIFRDIVSLAQASGMGLEHPILFATSPGQDVSPLSRPATGQHILLMGSATMVFCNYWAKVQTALIFRLKERLRESRLITIEDLHGLADDDPDSFRLPTALAAYFALTGTLVGFGNVPQSMLFGMHRIVLVQAMEAFAMGHEYAHCLAEERFDEFRAPTAVETAHDLEFFCDGIGLTLLRFWGTEKRNSEALSGAAAAVFLRAFDLCSQAQAVIGRTPALGGMHPTTDSRVAELRQLVSDFTPDDGERDAALSYFDEAELLMHFITEKVLTTLGELVSRKLTPG
jgi:hypothetical protein